MARSPDAPAARYADRAAAMAVSEVRALFAVAARPEVISLAGGMPYVEALPGDEVLEAVSAVLERSRAVALQYGGGSGHAGLRARLTEVMAEEGIDADPEEVLVTAGAQQALDLIGKLFIDRGDQIVVEAPSYVGALSAFSVYEPRYLQIPLDENGLVVEELERALRGGTRPKFVYTCTNFHNPAGVTLALDRRRRLVEICGEAGVPIIEDNAYGLLRFEGEGLPTLWGMDPDNVIYLGTLSKMFCPGIRVGWAMARGATPSLTRFKEAADLCSSNLNMLLAEEWLRDRDRWRRSLARLIEVYRHRRDAALEALEQHFPPGSRWTDPQGGFYVWVHLPPGVDSRALLPTAIERRVAYVPGTAFYPDGSGHDRLRIAFCYPPEEDVREGIRRLGELLQEAAA